MRRRERLVARQCERRVRLSQLFVLFSATGLLAHAVLGPDATLAFWPESDPRFKPKLGQ